MSTDKILNKITNIQYLRVLSMLMILVCHLVQESSVQYICMTAQFFNVGVSVFFAISGFLYGRKILQGYIRWYKNRWKRVLWPFYIFLVFLLIVYLLQGQKIEIINWLIQFLNLQGIQIYVHGAEHLWFLTVLAACYLITPLLNEWKKRKLNWNGILTLLLFATIICTYGVSTQLGVYLIYIAVYTIAYIIGCSQPYDISKKLQYLFVTAMVFAMCVRVVAKLFLDGTTLYNVLFVGVTQGIIAISLLMLCLSLKSEKECKIILFLDKISYEVYLVHYMFIVGPVSLIGVSNSLFFDSLIVLIVSFLVAFALEKISSF